LNRNSKWSNHASINIKGISKENFNQANAVSVPANPRQAQE
jgi:hypothetical protein